jgi:arsenate reductase (thioredoxin)
MSKPIRVLFVCTHNSARSQMAEGLLRELGRGRFEAASAGTEATRLHPFAIQAMAEVGIDISMQESKTIDRYLGEPFDLVITVCDDAAEACPVFPNARERVHWSFPDPSKAIGPDDRRFAVFAQIRDDIRARIENELLQPAGTTAAADDRRAAGGTTAAADDRRAAGGTTRG